MRIAFVVTSLANKGPVVLVRDLARCLKSGLNDVVVFHLDEKKTDLLFDCETQKISFFERVDFSGFDIVHSHGIRPDAFLLKNRKYISGKTFSTIHIYMQEDLLHTYNRLISWIIPPIWRIVLSSHDRIITLSRHMTNYYINLGINRSKLIHVYNSRCISENESIPREDAELIASISQGRKLIGLVGYLTSRKGVHQLIRLLAVQSNLSLLVIGDGPEKNKLIKLSEKLKVSDRVIFLGYRHAPEKYLPLIDIYGMTSYSEGFPLVLIEAGLKKRKVVCSDTALFRELFTEREVSFFELDNIKSLSDATLIALGSLDLADNLFESIQTNYSILKMTEGYLAVYRETLESIWKN